MQLTLILNYYKIENWSNELDRQLNLKNITDLDNCLSPDNFYGKYKDDIEYKLELLNKSQKINVEEQIVSQGKDYKSGASLIAYKATLSMIKDSIETGTFEIPVHPNIYHPSKQSMKKHEIELE